MVLRQNFGGVCAKTGEECVDLNTVDISLEGNVPASVVEGIFAGDINPEQYRAAPVVISDKAKIDKKEPASPTKTDDWDFQGF